MLSFAFEEIDSLRVQFTAHELNQDLRNAILRIGAK